jgi:Zn-dependent protease with chaperone function
MNDFFSHQDAARKNTRRLVVLFVLAVVAIVVAVYVAVVVIFAMNDVRLSGGLFVPELFLPIAGATLMVIGGGSAFKTLQLSDGGSAVGRLLGGRPLDPNTTDATERRVLNVVEEMAIVAGTPVPEVYMLEDERSINAFAAGRTPSAHQARASRRRPRCRCAGSPRGRRRCCRHPRCRATRWRRPRRRPCTGQ